jgi:hypothetical protein
VSVFTALTNLASVTPNTTTRGSNRPVALYASHGLSKHSSVKLRLGWIAEICFSTRNQRVNRSERFARGPRVRQTPCSGSPLPNTAEPHGIAPWFLFHSATQVTAAVLLWLGFASSPMPSITWIRPRPLPFYHSTTALLREESVRK